MLHTKLYIKGIIISTLMLFFYSNHHSLLAQNLVNCTLANIQYPTPTTMEFDIMIQSVTTSSIKLCAFQAGIEFDYNAISNGGTITASWVPGSSTALLPAGSQDLTQNVLALGPALSGSGFRQIRITAKLVNIAANAIPITSIPKKYATIRLTNNGGTFNSSVSPKFIWSCVAASQRTQSAVLVYNGTSLSSSLGTNQTTGGTPNATSPSAPYNYIAGPAFYVDYNPFCAAFFQDIISPALCYGGTGGSSYLVNTTSSGTYQVDGGVIQFFSPTNLVSVTGLSQGNHTITLQGAGASCPSYPFTVNITGPTSPIVNTTNINACGSYTWPVDGNTYTASGQYTAAGVNTSGCTATEILNLNLTNVVTYLTTIQTCGTYTWPVNGVTYTSSGTYYDSSMNQSSCLTINQLDLTIAQIPVVTAPAVTSCTNIVTLGGTPSGGTWNLPNPYTGNASSYTYYYTNAAGCTGMANGSISFQSNSINSIQVNAQNIGSTAIVNWTGNGNWFECRYRNINATTWITSTTSVLSKALLGLTPNTVYTVEVRGFCTANAASASPWLGTSFTSGPGCMVPGNVTNSGLTSTTATFTWSPVAGALFYRTTYHKVGIQTWINGTSNTTTKVLAGLLPSTNYEFRVQAVCGAGNNYSQYSTIYSFTTPVLKSGESVLEEQPSAFQVYPNPANSEIHVDVPLNEYASVTMRVLDVSGRVIKHIQMDATPGLNNLTLDLLDIIPGIYMLEVNGNDRLLYTTHFSKQ